MNKKLVIILGSLGFLLLFAVSFIVFLKMKSGTSESARKTLASLPFFGGEIEEEEEKVDPEASPESESADSEEPAKKTQRAIQEVAASMWEIPAPFDLEELQGLRDALTRERAIVEKLRDEVHFEKAELARRRSDLDEREAIVDTKTGQLQAISEEISRSRESQKLMHQLNSDLEEATLSNLVETYGKMKSDKAAEALKAFGDEAVALRILMALQDRQRASILSKVEPELAARWSERIREIEWSRQSDANQKNRSKSGE